MNALLLIGTGRGLLLLLALANIRLYTELLSAVQVGRLSILIAITSVLSVLVDRSLGAYWYRMLVSWNQAGVLRGQLHRFIGALAIIGVAGAAATALLAETVGFGVAVSLPALAALAFCGIVLNSLFSAVTGSLNILGARGAFVAISVASVGLGLALSVSAGLRLPQAEWWLAGGFLAQAVVILPGLWLLDRHLAAPRTDVTPAGLDAASWRRFAGPAVVSAALYSAQLLGYRFVLNGVAGTKAVAFFTVAFGLGVAAMNAFDYFVTQLAQPRFFRRLTDADPSAMASAWNAYARAVVPAVILMALFTGAAGPLILRLGASSTFGAAGRIVAFGVAADALRILAQLVAMVPHATLETRRLVLPSIVGVTVSLVVGGALATVWPLAGMGIGLVLGGTIWLGLSYRVARRMLPIQVPWRVGALALAGGLPLALGLEAAYRTGVTDSVRGTFAVLATGGGVLMVLQYAFARRWLADVSASVVPYAMPASANRDD